MNRWTDKMDDGISYKDFFEKLDSIHKDITEIKVQTTKTNGRVTNCESKIMDHDNKLSEIMKYNQCQDKEINRLILKVSIIIAIVSFIVYKTTGYLLAL